ILGAQALNIQDIESFLKSDGRLVAYVDLENSIKTAEKDLSIQQYEVIPLSPSSGLIGWVPHCDTLHQLIREYRDARKITLNQEHKHMLIFAPDYDHLTLVARVEVFEYALDNTEGNDSTKACELIMEWFGTEQRIAKGKAAASALAQFPTGYIDYQGTNMRGQVERKRALRLQAHAVMADGGVITHVGLNMVALAAQRHVVPFVDLASTHKTYLDGQI
ncbi:serine/threonine-protein kinase TOR, partial [Tanacetum coccineum]